MTLRYKVGDLCYAQLGRGVSNPSVRDGTIVRLISAYGEVGWYIDHPNSSGWWSEEYLDLVGSSSKSRSGFAKFIQRIEDGKH